MAPEMKFYLDEAAMADLLTVFQRTLQRWRCEDGHSATRTITGRVFHYVGAFDDKAGAE
jgi:hypothetical protein